MDGFFFGGSLRMECLWKTLTISSGPGPAGAPVTRCHTCSLSAQISTCHTLPCTANVEKECLWTDWLLEDKLAGEQVRNSACIRRLDGSCSWYRGAPALEENFLHMNDP